ncbi:MAG: 23S rRNA (uracil(1939)-C(5))-methyltransferase RlmD [Gammaproteobacteria bacterium]|nr:MAG: 23S rRNA (uracil(1939)-C(5))-methyltransferase RlmD [Gammaproteobacteria bacterium]
MSRRRRRKLQDAPVEIHIESLTHEGRGLAHVDGKTVFVDGALPGETVMARYVNCRRNYDELTTTELVSAPAPERVTPPCPHYERCGGCSLQHLAPEAQIEHKQSVLAELFGRIGHLERPEMAAPIRSRDLGYRTKARLGVRYVRARDEVLVGFRERHSNFLTAIDRCPVLIEAVGERIEALKALFRSLEAYDSIPQVEVAAGDDAVALVVRHLKPLSQTDTEALEAFGEQTGLQIWLQPKGPDTVHRLWPVSDEAPRLHYSGDGGAVTYAFHPLDFTQVNREVNAAMLAQALDWLDLRDTDTVLDLFCGLGNFTLPLARRAGHVTGVEGVQMMVDRGYENARANGLENVTFCAADLHSALDARAGWIKGYDKVLLDPPRSGAELMCREMHRFNPGVIVYVSCNPATLARDAGILAEQGYRLVRAGVMDMFPHTGHVESMALFRRADREE